MSVIRKLVAAVIAACAVVVISAPAASAGVLDDKVAIVTGSARGIG